MIEPTDLNFGFLRSTFSFEWLQDIEGLFQMLDYDGGGSLDTDEFCEGLDLRNWFLWWYAATFNFRGWGILRASTSEKPLELTRLVKQCSDILKLCHLDSERVLIQIKVDDWMKDKIARAGSKQ